MQIRTNNEEARVEYYKFLSNLSLANIRIPVYSLFPLSFHKRYLRTITLLLEQKVYLLTSFLEPLPTN